jgi:hypothetical protein
MSSSPSLIPVAVFGVGCLLLALEVCFIVLVNHGRAPRRRRPSGPIRHADEYGANGAARRNLYADARADRSEPAAHRLVDSR